MLPSPQRIHRLPSTRGGYLYQVFVSQEERRSPSTDDLFRILPCTVMLVQQVSRRFSHKPLRKQVFFRFSWTSLQARQPADNKLSGRYSILLPGDAHSSGFGCNTPGSTFAKCPLPMEIVSYTCGRLLSSPSNIATKEAAGKHESEASKPVLGLRATSSASLGPGLPGKS